MGNYTYEAREQYAQALLSSRKAITLNAEVMKGLGYDSTRDFFLALGNWGYVTDFNRFSPTVDERPDLYIRAFIRDTFCNN